MVVIQLNVNVFLYILQDSSDCDACIRPTVISKFVICDVCIHCAFTNRFTIFPCFHLCLVLGLRNYWQIFTGFVVLLQQTGPQTKKRLEKIKWVIHIFRLLQYFLFLFSLVCQVQQFFLTGLKFLM